jgi:hypothetical protein
LAFPFLLLLLGSGFRLNPECDNYLTLRIFQFLDHANPPIHRQLGISSVGLKTQYGLAINKVRGLRNVASYALYSLLCLVLNREAAENVRRPDKAVSPTYFNT